jgi:hypothetical protein
MKDLLAKLDVKEIAFVCYFANCYITQIPYIDKVSVICLNKDYLIKRIKANINKGLFKENELIYANIILIKNNLK